MSGEDSPPGQSSPLAAGNGNSVDYLSNTELRESSPQIERHLA